MASFMRRAMVYLGLQDDDEHHYDQYSGYPDYPGEEHDDTGEAGYGREPYRNQYDSRSSESRNDSRHEMDRSGDIRELRPAPEPYGKEPTVRTIPRDEPPSAVTVSSTVMRTSASSARVHVVEPHGFNDAQEIGDRLKASQPVIMNLQGVPRELQRRLIDFSSGLAYGVGGSMSRVADQVFLLTPTNVEVSQEEKERLQARGLYHG
jgi:cell division inhibitor SepF